MAVDIEKLAQLGSMAATGGYAQAALGGLQAVYGLSQLPKAKAEFERARAAAPSLETPSQFYENYKNAYDGELARMQSDAIQANLATSVQALQRSGRTGFSWRSQSSDRAVSNATESNVGSRASDAYGFWTTTCSSRRTFYWS